MTSVTLELINENDGQALHGFELDETAGSLGEPGSDLTALWVPQPGGSPVESISLHVTEETEELDEGVATWFAVTGLELGDPGTTVEGCAFDAIIIVPATYNGEPGFLEIPFTPPAS